MPDCGAGQTLLVESARFAFLPEGCTPDVDCAAVRADVVTREPIPDGAVAYRCNVVGRDQVNELVAAVSIALGVDDLAACPAALDGCPN